MTGPSGARGTSSPSEGEAPEAALRWTVHPAAQHPGRAVLLLGILAAAGVFTAQVAEAPAFGVVASVLLFWSVRAWFLPRTYELDARGVREAGPLCPGRELAWEAVRRVSRQPFGLHVSPRAVDSRWLPDRGLLLRTVGNRPTVLEHIQRWAPEVAA